MCIILFQWQPDADIPLIAAANRDEFYQRPTEAARWRGNVFCGLDQRAGGTWMGVTREGRFAAVTNFREPIQANDAGQRSRGDLPWQFLQGTDTPDVYAKQLVDTQQEYGPFNLLVGDSTSLWYISNRGAAPQAVSPGLHGLSNGLLDTPWPKIKRGKQLLSHALQQGAKKDDLLHLLADNSQPPEEELPNTGVPPALERLVAPIFVQSAQYGTRCSTLLWLPKKGEPRIMEKRWAGVCV